MPRLRSNNQISNKPSLRTRLMHTPVTVYRKSTSGLRRHPFISFLVVLLLLFGLIAISNILFKPKVEEAQKPEVIKEVSVFTVGSTPKTTFQAKIEKSGVIKIVALAPGVVETISVKEGDSVQKGANLVQLSSSYSGGNPAQIQSSIASKQAQLANETFQTQKDLITKQREVASQTSTNATELRNISSQSIEDTRANINLVQQNMDQIVSQVDELETIPNPTPEQEATIQQLRGTQSQLQSALVQARNGLRNLEYQANPSNPPSQLADLQKDMTLKQLDIQEKSLVIQKEVANLGAAAAFVAAQTFHPTAPFAGTVDRVFVHLGEVVNPGTTLLSFVGSSTTVNAVINVPQNVAQQVSTVETTVFHINETTLELHPVHISQDATEGQLHSLLYVLPDGYSNSLTEGQFISADLPVGNSSSTGNIPFIPLDSVYQSQDSSIVYINEGGVAKSRTVKLGSIVGRYVEVSDGITATDQVITNRNVVEGDKVTISN